MITTCTTHREINIEEAAIYLGNLDSRTVQKWANWGYLPVSDGCDDSCLFLQNDLDHWMRTTSDKESEERIEEAVHDVYRGVGHERLPMILQMRSRFSRYEWECILGQHWTDFDRIYPYRIRLRSLLGTGGPVRNLMTLEENVLYDQLPESVICYRGCDASHLVGASWSTDREIANSFPFFQRHSASVPVVVTAKVRKQEVLAVKIDRGEAEIITFSARRLKIEPAVRRVAARTGTVSDVNVASEVIPAASSTFNLIDLDYRIAQSV
jgi:hypothetical protein